jgi:hypothetical protein
MLAQNLTTAAALCRSWQLGAAWCDDLWAIMDPIPFEKHPVLIELDWQPGCGKPAPMEVIWCEHCADPQEAAR